MRTVFCVLCLTLVMLTIQGCMTPNPTEAKAKQILKEISEIAGKPVGGQGKQEIMEAMNRLNHEKETFPDGRGQIIADAHLGKRFFSSGIDQNKHIVELLEQLLTLPISEADSNCVQKSILTNNAQIEQMELTVKQMDVFLDENIVDKEELDEKVSQLREDGKAAEMKFDQLTSEQKDMCSKSKLGIK